MEIYVLDSGLNLSYITDEASSVIWHRKYFEPGEFQVVTILSQENLDAFKIGNFVWLHGQDEVGVIEHIEFRQEKDGSQSMIIVGSLATGLLRRRIILGTEYINDTVENAMRRIVNNHAVSPADSARDIPSLVLGELKGYPERITYQVSYANVCDELQRLGQLAGLGYRVLLDYDSKQLIFDVYKGVDRTAGQSVNSRAVFSTDYENVLEQTYIDSMKDYRNVAIVAGAGEGAERIIATAGAGIGLDRLEIYIDARDLQPVDEMGNPIPEPEYIELLVNRGLTKLAQYPLNRTYDANINVVSGNLVYRQDFDLGDLVTIKNDQWGVTIDTRITEMEEVYEQTGMDVYATFGNKLPTLIDKIRKGGR